MQESGTNAGVQDPRAGAESMIRAAELSKSFGPVRAVRGVSFDVARGELVGFLGPNGAGKSTTMKMLTGSLLPDTGRAWIAGEPLDGRTLGARAAVGYLPEHTPLYREMRVWRYLEFVGEVHGMSGRERADALERVVDACDLTGYTGRRIETLSKGYRQRVGLAQALFADPDVLVLDEPTSGLDPAEIVRIRDLVTGLARTKTILLSTHVLSEVEEICRRVLIIAGGRLVADGTLDELVEEGGDAISLLVGAAPADCGEAFDSLAGVADAHVAASHGGSRARVTLRVEDDRFEVAERVAAVVHERGWPLLELRHDATTLERVFLARTRSIDAGAAEGDA
ncbi:MAG: ATP-binding cassette domain-containing protein [Planctomycetota bacterium]